MSAWRSLRVRTLLVACAVAFVPLPLVWVFGKTEPATRSVLLVAAKRAAEDGAATPDDLAVVAAQRRVRLRLLDPDGTVTADTSYEPDGPVAWIDRRFYGPDGIPTLTAWDAEQPPVALRPLIEQARRSGEAAGCTSNEALTLLVCEAAVRRDDGRIVFAQRSSHLAVRALYEDRWPLLQLAFMVAALAVLLGGWLGWRLVRPIAALRTAALDRVAHPLTAPPIGMDRGDEFGELAAAFDTLLAAVRQQASAHEAFVADLAHEMKNPVAAIRAAAESLQNGDVSPQRAERLSRALADSSGRLDRLITDLLELARAEAGVPRDERRTLSLDALARGVVSALAADERFADVALHADTAGVLVAGDAGGLETALRNLLINAASFAGKGGRVDVRVLRERDRAVVEVRDSGPGIAPDDLPRVFDRFFTTRPGQGTGLGLALVRAITEAHDGVAIALSPPGSGALFRLELPAVDI